MHRRVGRWLANHIPTACCCSLWNSRLGVMQLLIKVAADSIAVDHEISEQHGDKIICMDTRIFTIVHLYRCVSTNSASTPDAVYLKHIHHFFSSASRAI